MEDTHLLHQALQVTLLVNLLFYILWELCDCDWASIYICVCVCVRPTQSKAYVQSISFFRLMCLSFCNINQPQYNFEVHPSKETPPRAGRVSGQMKIMSLTQSYKVSLLPEKWMHVYVMVDCFTNIIEWCLLGRLSPVCQVPKNKEGLVRVGTLLKPRLQIYRDFPTFTWTNQWDISSW